MSTARLADVLDKVQWMVDYYVADPARAKLHCKCRSYKPKDAGGTEAPGELQEEAGDAGEDAKGEVASVEGTLGPGAGGAERVGGC